MQLLQVARSQAWVSTLLLIVLTLLLYNDTVMYLTGLWNQLEEGEYAHGYLVLAISLYLIYINRQKLAVIQPVPEYRALFAIIAASMMWLAAALAAVEVVQAFALLLLLLAITWMMLGNQAIRVMAFPILFIAFAIPVWFPLSPVLQNIAADSVFWFVRLLSIPAFRQDNSIVLPAGTMSVEEACSGLRYLLAALTLGSLYAYMNYATLRSRVTIVLVCAISAIFANVLRVFIVVYLGYKTEMQHPLVDDHLSLGWYLFAGVVVILLVIDTFIYNNYANKTKELAQERDGLLPAENKVENKVWLRALIIGGCLASAAPVVMYKVDQKLLENAVMSAPGLPQQVNGWQRTDAADDGWLPVYNGAINQKQYYSKNSNHVTVYTGFYPVQKQGKELISVLNHISSNDTWRRLYPVAEKQKIDSFEVLEQKLRKEDTSHLKLVWYWYKVAGKVTTNRYEAKLLQVLGLLGGQTQAMIIAVAVPVHDEISSSRHVLKDMAISIRDEI